METEVEQYGTPAQSKYQGRPIKNVDNYMITKVCSCVLIFM
jgi:hypothetical protein